MSDDIVARLRDLNGWVFEVPESGHHQNAGNTRAPIFVPEHKSKNGQWIPVLVETGYSDGFRYYMFNSQFLLRQAADEIERLRELSGDAGKLRKELHKARCIACDIYARRSMKNYLKRAISFSKEMGWDCFKEDSHEH